VLELKIHITLNNYNMKGDNILLQNQIKIYSVDTRAFYSEKEQKINREIIDCSLFVKWIKEYEAVKYLIPTSKKCSVGFNFLKYYGMKLKYESYKKNYQDIKDNKQEYKLLEIYFKTIETLIRKKKSKLKHADYQEQLKKNVLYINLSKNLKYLNYQLSCEIVSPKVIKIEEEIKDFMIGLRNKHKEYKKLTKSKLKKIMFKNNKSAYDILELKKNLVNRLKDKGIVRRLNKKVIKPYNQVSVFESYLTRVLGIQENSVTTDLFIVKVNDHEHEQKIIEQLIEFGFTFGDKQTKYCVFTASAGQIRKHKVVFISEKVLQNNMNTIMCGLSPDIINNSNLQGCNTNKWLAYLALTYSASDIWEGFNIDKAIVVDDFETEVSGIVDYIDNKSFEISKKKQMTIPIAHSDGCGMYLKNGDNDKPFMFRMPFFKGLIVPVPYLDYKTKNGDYKIIDIYSKVWDLKKDGIQYIFSKSQFKMAKYYANCCDKNGKILKYGWDIYKECFKKFRCHAGKCNEESDNIIDKSINYQMIQSLTDVSDDEIDYLTKNTIEYINNSYRDVRTMLSMLGVSKNNNKMNYMQQALSIYPELFRDHHNKKMLENTIASRKNDAKFAKIKLDAKYTYLIPDVFAWLQFLLDGEKNPKGLLKEGEVFCQLYKKRDKLAVLRSPHLYREWAVRKHTYNKEFEKWYCTKGIYTSCHDLISKVLQFDNDGDTSLVVADKKTIDIAERNIENITFNGVKLNEYMFEYGYSEEEIYEEVYLRRIVPLYYKMETAPIEQLNKKNIIYSMKLAWKYGNIGEYSNKITTLWNNENVDLDLIAVLTAFNNYSIDAAKTKYMVKFNKKDHAELLEKYNKLREMKLPYFFQFAKADKVDDVAKINNSTVNRICSNIESIPKQKYQLKDLGKFDYKKLMSNPDIEVNQNVIDKFLELDKQKNMMFINSVLPKSKCAKGIYDECKKQLLLEFFGMDLTSMADMIIKYLYTNKKESMKTFLWEAFGNIIVDNLRKNVGESFEFLKKGKVARCKVCGDKFDVKSNRQVMCEECAKDMQLKWQRESMKKIRNVK